MNNKKEIVGIDASLRLCKSCGLEKSPDSFGTRRRLRDGVMVITLCTQCKPCVAAYSRRRMASPEAREKRNTYLRAWSEQPKQKERMRAYFQRPEYKERQKLLRQHPEAKEKANARHRRRYKRADVKEFHKNYLIAYRLNAENKGLCKKYRDTYTAGLADSYIRALITNRTLLKASDIPMEMVEVKRLQVQIKREIKRREANA